MSPSDKNGQGWRVGVDGALPGQQRLPHVETRSLPTDDTPLLVAALMYAARGWRVLPLHTLLANKTCSCGDAECRPGGKKEKSIAKHPRIHNWQNAATTDEALIRAWWKAWPLANIGIAMGRASGVVALDVDVHRDKPGFESLAALEAELGPLPPTLTVVTGSGGQHRYVAPAAIEIRDSAGWRSHEGIDWRGDGGQVVAPPSVALRGRYGWAPGPAVPAQLPAAWVEAHRVYEEQRGQKKFCASGPSRPSTPPTAEELAEDNRVLQMAQAANNAAKFSRLWVGEWTKPWKGERTMYPSQSEADQALCVILSFWAKGNADRVDRLFRRSGLYRDKWLRADYRERTIDRAIRFEEKRAADLDDFTKRIQAIFEEKGGAQ